MSSLGRQKAKSVDCVTPGAAIEGHQSPPRSAKIACQEENLKNILGIGSRIAYDPRMGLHRKPAPARPGSWLRYHRRGFEFGCRSLWTNPVREATGLTFWVWNDRFDRGGSRCLAGGFVCGLFVEMQRFERRWTSLGFVPPPDRN